MVCLVIVCVHIYGLRWCAFLSRVGVFGLADLLFGRYCGGVALC